MVVVGSDSEMRGIDCGSSIAGVCFMRIHLSLLRLIPLLNLLRLRRRYLQSSFAFRLRFLKRPFNLLLNGSFNGKFLFSILFRFRLR